MDKVKCELCPVSSECAAYKEAREDNDASYHPQTVVRVWNSNCPLIPLVKSQEIR